MKKPLFLSVAFLLIPAGLAIWWMNNSDPLDRAGARLEQALRAGDAKTIISFANPWETKQLQSQGVDIELFVKELVVPLFKSQLDLSEKRSYPQVPSAERVYEVKGNQIAVHSITMVETDLGPRTFLVRNLFLDRARALAEANNPLSQDPNHVSRRHKAMLLVLAENDAKLRDIGLDSIPSNAIDGQPASLDKFRETSIAVLREKSVAKIFVDDLLAAGGFPPSTGEEKITFLKMQ